MAFLRFLTLSCALLLSSISPCSADVEFTSPQGGASIPAGTAIQVRFKDSGDAPSISDLKSYQLFLCAGGDTIADQVQLKLIEAAGSFSTLSVTTDAISNGLGGSTTNAYFFKMISPAVAGGTVTNYSPRFSLTGMKGTFPPGVVTALASISGTSPPPTVNNVGVAAPAPAAPAPVVPAGAFNVPFSMQTGTVRYAPMAKQPGTKITKKKTAPLNPTSAFNIARGPMPPPSVVTTVSQGPASNPASIANTAAPAPMPMDDMQKFLNRWKD